MKDPCQIPTALTANADHALEIAAA
jgi:hypothetical protein